MNIHKYKVTAPIEILNTMFLDGDIFYATESFHVMNGVFAYARKVFDENKKYLGMIDDRNFPKKVSVEY